MLPAIPSPFCEPPPVRAGFGGCGSHGEKLVGGSDPGLANAAPRSPERKVHLRGCTRGLLSLAQHRTRSDVLRITVFPLWLGPPTQGSPDH